MSAQSKQQFKMIHTKRSQYGSKSDTPDKYKFIWDEDWTDVDYDKLPTKKEQIDELSRLSYSDVVSSKNRIYWALFADIYEKVFDKINNQPKLESIYKKLLQQIKNKKQKEAATFFYRVKREELAGVLNLESINIPIEIGDVILMGKWRNKKVVVKDITTDDYGMPLINGKQIMKIRMTKPETTNENLIDKDEQKIRDIIRDELADIFQDLSRKRAVWDHVELTKENNMKKSELRKMIREEIKKLNESYQIDTWSASDSDTVIEILKKNKVRYDKKGPIITIKLDRKSLKSAMVHSQFDKAIGDHWDLV